jgi:hypothetical protein
MSCINCNNGPFINDGTVAWLTNNITITTPNGVTLTQVLGGANPGIFVSKGAVNQPFQENGDTLAFLNWGTPKNFLAVLRRTTTQRFLTLINTADPTLKTNTILNPGATSADQGPFINYCQGDGSIILTIFQTNLALWPADGNTTMALAAGTATNPAQSFATVTATQIEIHSGSNVVAAVAKPTGHCVVMPGANPPATIDFGTVVIGAGVPASLTTKTIQATIKNTGTSCLQISTITNLAPFSVVPASFTAALLQPGDKMMFDILFDPGTTTGSPFSKDLTINPVPVAGDKVIKCKGLARAPQLKLSVVPPVFPLTPKGTTSSPVNLQIKNLAPSEGDVNLQTFPAPTAPEFTWTPPIVPVTIPYGGLLNIPVTFSPIVEGVINRVVTLTSSAANSPHIFTLSGTGCSPHAVISLSANPVALGEVQKGFRTVRIFKIANPGNDILTFDADIEAAVPADPNSVADAAFFGLLSDETTPVTSPLPSFVNKTIRPTSPCGNFQSGTGEYDFGIAFFAGDGAALPTPRTVNAILRIFNHNDTSSGAPASFSITLTATITNPVSVDAAMVIDRSGSMADPSGTRKKIDTAIDAAKLFVRLSRPDVDDRLSVVRFNNVPEIIPSLGIQSITSANQLAIEGQINPANLTPSGSTCIAGGVIVAETDIRNNPRAVTPTALNKIILVLTDGIDNTNYLNPADGQKYSLLGDSTSIALPVPTDLKIYALGIGNDIDVARLGQLATSTGGVFLHTIEFSGPDYFNLEKHFTQVYMEAVNYAQIADPVFDILPGETQTFDFEVLNGDKSAIVVIYDKDFIRVPFQIFTPLGELIDLLSVPAGFQIRPGITPTARFIEINMPPGEPARYAGSWKILVTHDKRACYSTGENSRTENMPDNYAYGFQPVNCKDGYDTPITYGIAIGVGSNFNLVAFVSPGIVKIGEPILLSAMIAEFGLPVKGCTVLVKEVKPDGTISWQTLFDDGNHGDDAADDGSYAVSFTQTSQEGTYTFTFSATGYSRDGKQIQREVVRSKYVEGRVPLVNPNPSSGSGLGVDKCCESMKSWLRVVVIILVLIVILLLLIWRRSV